MSKIRVLHCIETIASGGVEQVRLTLIRGLDKTKFEHKFICTWKGGSIAEALEKEAVLLIPIGSFAHPFEWKKHRQVLKVIREFKPHIIHGAIFEGMSMAAIYGTLGKVPVRILEETSEPVSRSKKILILQKLFLSVSDQIIGISPSVVDFLLKKVKLPKGKVRLINNGIEISNPKGLVTTEQLKKTLGIEEDDFIIGSVGRVYDQVKRFSDILLATKEFKFKKVKFLLVGDGPDLNYIKELAIIEGLNNQFISVGYQSNPHPYFDVMDAFCIVSAHEGFGLVVAEAMMHSLPVIASKVGGLKDVILDEETGFLVPPFSPQDIAHKIQILINEPELRVKMGDKGNKRVLKKYSADRYVKKVESLYFELLKVKGVKF